MRGTRQKYREPARIRVLCKMHSDGELVSPAVEHGSQEVVLDSSRKALARDLRRGMTEAERLLWFHLRGRRMRNCKFRRQVVVGSYIVDFACLEAKLIVEADGGQHSYNRTKDARRTRFLEHHGYRVIRFWNDEILTETESVLEAIHRQLADDSHRERAS